MDYDYSQFQTETLPGEEAFARLTSMVDLLQEAEREVLAREDELKKAQERVRDLSEQQIPDLLEDMNLEKFKMKDGRDIELKNTIRASITAANKPSAFRWLEENGHGGLIKRNITVALGRNEQEAAVGLLKDLHDHYANVKQDMKVEAPTLKKFVTEQMDEGADIPVELFGVFRQRKVKVK